MKIIYFQSGSGNKVYLFSHDTANRRIETCASDIDAEELTQAQAETVKTWLTNQMGYSENVVHIGTSPKPH